MNLPRFVTEMRDRNVTIRLRFRRRGFRAHYFVSALGTAAFEAEFRLCLSGVKPPNRYALQPKQRRLNARRAGERVYFIGGESGPVKIGVSSQPIDRLADLQTAHPLPLHILATATGGLALERAYHRRFKTERIRGEWFERTAELEAEISLLVSNSLTGSV